MEFSIHNNDNGSDYQSIFNAQSNNRMSKNILTKYEKTQLIGMRTEQLAYGAPTTLSIDDEESCKSIKQIAELELTKKLIPMIICRYLPNKKKEYWKLDELIVL